MKKPAKQQTTAVTTSLGTAGAPVYEKTGFCPYCLMSIEAKQPGGLEPRHLQTKVPYAECPQAIDAKKREAEAKLVKAKECTCTGCGCTDSKACPGGCWWASVDREKGTGLCSNCA